MLSHVVSRPRIHRGLVQLFISHRRIASPPLRSKLWSTQTLVQRAPASSEHITAVMHCARLLPLAGHSSSRRIASHSPTPTARDGRTRADCHAIGRGIGEGGYPRNSMARRVPTTRLPYEAEKCPMALRARARACAAGLARGWARDSGCRAGRSGARSLRLRDALGCAPAPRAAP